MSVLDQPHWRYWKCVLKEVENKKNKNYPCKFTDINTRLQSVLDINEERASYEIHNKRRIYLESTDQEIYFSRREAECAYQLAQGKTLREVAQTLSLSIRTIEYYMKNMKAKLKCRTRSELVGKIMSSGFCNRYMEVFG